MQNTSAAVLVMDLGLTNCKCVVFSASGELLGRAYAAYQTYYPEAGQVEQDPEEWWQAIVSATQQLWDATPDLAARVECISVTGHMHALVGLDRQGSPLTRALVLGDRRSVTAAAEIAQELELPMIYRITGARMDASMPAAKIRWLKEYAPGVHQATWLFTGCKDFIRHRLTGDRLTDPIDACAMSLYDIQGGVWSPEMMTAAGVSDAQLPDVGSPTDIAGVLREDAARALGIKAGISVVIGGGDDIEVLGNGLMSSGSSLEHLGTTGSILTCAEEPVYDPDMALELYPHAESGLWVLGGSITSAGSALAWAAETLGFDSMADALALLNQDAPSTSTLLFLPHLMGERCPNWEPDVRGAWIGLTATHSDSDLMRAAFEGVAFALRSMLQRIEVLVGTQDQITVAKRPNDNRGWLQTRASIYDRPLAVLRTGEPTALGAMMLAAVGVGMYESLYEVVDAITGQEVVVQPQSEALYGMRFDAYQTASAALLPLWTTLQQGAG